MIEENLTAEEIKSAKKLATHPLGQQIATFALRFTAAALIGELDARGIFTPEVNNGSVTLVDFDNGPIGITCFHVVEEYRRRRQSNSRTSFQIGSLRLDPLRSLIDENAELDLVTIGLGNHDLSRISCGSEFGARFFRPPLWPPKDIAEGDYVVFGGYPGALRKARVGVEVRLSGA